ADPDRASDLGLRVALVHVEFTEERVDLSAGALLHQGLGVALAVGHACILHVCKMLSTRQESYGADRSSREWPWSPRARLHSLADVQEPSIDLDREEYMARLGVVLQLARKAARIAPGRRHST